MTVCCVHAAVQPCTSLQLRVGQWCDCCPALHVMLVIPSPTHLRRVSPFAMSRAANSPVPLSLLMRLIVTASDSIPDALQSPWNIASGPAGTPSGTAASAGAAAAARRVDVCLATDGRDRRATWFERLRWRNVRHRCLVRGLDSIIVTPICCGHNCDTDHR